MEKIIFQALLNRLTAAKITEAGTMVKEIGTELDTVKDLTDEQKGVFLSALLIEYGRMEQEKKKKEK